MQLATLSPTRASYLVTANVYTNVTALALVQSVFLSSKSCFDGIFGHLQLLCADSAVMVDHSQTKVSPDDSCSFRRSASGHSRSTLGHFLFAVYAGLEPCAEDGAGGRKCSGCLRP